MASYDPARLPSCPACLEPPMDGACAGPVCLNLEPLMGWARGRMCPLLPTSPFRRALLGWQVLWELAASPLPLTGLQTPLLSRQLPKGPAGSGLTCSRPSPHAPLPSPAGQALAQPKEKLPSPTLLVLSPQGGVLGCRSPPCPPKQGSQPTLPVPPGPCGSHQHPVRRAACPWSRRSTRT